MVFVIMCAKTGPCVSFCANASASASSLSAADQSVEEAPALALFRAHGAAGEQQFRRAALPDHARQHRAGTHVAAGKSHAGKQESGLCLRRAKPHVAKQRNHGTGANADAINGSDDRLRAGAHGFHEIAGHAREFEQTFHVLVRAAAR